MAVTVAPADPAALAAALAAHGYAVIDTPARDPDEPWGFVEALIGVRGLPVSTEDLLAAVGE